MNEIVAAVSHEGSIFIFMRNGQVYEMVRDTYNGQFVFRLMHEMLR